MKVIENLSDEERYLFAIIDDQSGLDLAEFTWLDQETNRPWRAWPFQWRWFRDMSPLQIDQCARAVGKSTSIVVRMHAFPFSHPGQEALITAPELVHLEPVTKLVERRFQETRLAAAMLPKSRSAITHRPFMMNFNNGARIMGRIPQRTGRGVKGAHPLVLELDEAQDFPEDGWTELIETLRRGIEGSVWRAHGVTRGVRDKFFEMTQPSPDNKWKVHRIVAMARPTWSDEERDQKIQEYKSRENPDYRRNILGLHGDAQNPLFVTHRLMACVDDNQGSDYNCVEYRYIHITHEMLTDRGYKRDIGEFMPLPEIHQRYDVVWIGMDVGYTHDPSEILVFAEVPKASGEETRLKLINRLRLERISNPDQVAAIVRLFQFYRPKAFSMDKTGAGLPLFQDLQRAAPDVAGQIKGYNFSEKILVDFDEQILKTLEPWDDDIKEAGIHQYVLEVATDYLRDMVDRERIQLPWDTTLLREFQGQTFTYSKEPIDLYGKRRRIFSVGSFHALDAARMAVLGWRQHSLETMIDLRHEENDQPILDVAIMI